MTQKISGAPMYDGAPFYSKTNSDGFIDLRGPITCMKRLKLELGNRQYYCDEDYNIFLDENDISGEDTYDKKVHLVGILKTALAILQAMTNNIDYLMTIDTEFGNRSEAYSALQKKISDLRRSIKDAQDAQNKKKNDITFLFKD